MADFLDRVYSRLTFQHGTAKSDLSEVIVTMIFGAALSILVAGVYIFFLSLVEGSRTNYVCFEDDDYDYYVKAIPKRKVSTPEKAFRDVNTRKLTRL